MQHHVQSLYVYQQFEVTRQLKARKGFLPSFGWQVWKYRSGADRFSRVRQSERTFNGQKFSKDDQIYIGVLYWLQGAIFHQQGIPRLVLLGDYVEK